MQTRARWTLAVAATMAATTFAACGDDGPTASFTAPSEGDSVAGGVAFDLAANGVTIEEAGDVREGRGHFHVIADAGCLDEGDAVPRDADHVHLGQGQADGVVYLEPGSHELCVQVGDGAHAALDVTDTVTVDVGIVDRDQWCRVVRDTDELFTSADTDGEEFPIRQVAYENTRRLITQLADGIDQVDADVRDDVAEALDWARSLAAAFADAEDAGAAEAAVAEIFSTEGIPSEGRASTWILDTCGVDIDG